MLSSVKAEVSRYPPSKSDNPHDHLVQQMAKLISTRLESLAEIGWYMRFALCVRLNSHVNDVSGHTQANAWKRLCIDAFKFESQAYDWEFNAIVRP